MKRCCPSILREWKPFDFDIMVVVPGGCALMVGPSEKTGPFFLLSYCR